MISPLLPGSWGEAVEALTALGIIVSAFRIWLVRPILRRIDDHNADHEASRAFQSRFAAQFDPVDDEECLPYAERGLPLRALVVNARVGQIRTDRVLREHVGWSRSTIARMNAERRAAGVDELPMPDGGIAGD